LPLFVLMCVGVLVAVFWNNNNDDDDDMHLLCVYHCFVFEVLLGVV